MFKNRLREYAKWDVLLNRAAVILLYLSDSAITASSIKNYKHLPGAAPQRRNELIVAVTCMPW